MYINFYKLQIFANTSFKNYLTPTVSIGVIHCTLILFQSAQQVVLVTAAYLFVLLVTTVGYADLSVTAHQHSSVTQLSDA